MLILISQSSRDCNSLIRNMVRFGYIICFQKNLRMFLKQRKNVGVCAHLLTAPELRVKDVRVGDQILIYVLFS